MPESPRFGDLVRVTSTGVRGTQWQSTVDERGNYDGKDLVEAGVATLRVIKRYESPLMARHPSQETIPSPWPNPAAEEPQPDIAAFLRERYDEREQCALAASNPDERPAGAVWTRECGHDEEYPPYGGWPCTSCCVVDGDSIRIYDEGGHDAEQALHIADNDPRYVLDDIAAKRRLIAGHGPGRVVDESGGRWASDPDSWDPPWTKCTGHDWVAYPCEMLRLLALPFAGHPQYREGWKP